MPYNTRLADRMRSMLYENPRVTEQKMFGGVGFMVNGNLACGVHGDGIIVRVGEPAYAAAMQKPYVGVFDMTGRPMKGWITVDQAGVSNDADLAAWIKAGMDFASSLPPK